MRSLSLPDHPGNAICLLIYVHRICCIRRYVLLHSCTACHMPHSLSHSTEHALRIFSFAFVTRWLSFAVQSFMLAIEKPGYAALISISTAFIFPVLLLFALQGFGLDGIWFNFAGTNALAAVLSIAVIVKERKEIMKADA